MIFQFDHGKNIKNKLWSHLVNGRINSRNFVSEKSDFLHFSLSWCRGSQLKPSISRFISMQKCSRVFALTVYVWRWARRGRGTKQIHVHRSLCWSLDVKEKDTVVHVHGFMNQIITLPTSLLLWILSNILHMRPLNICDLWPEIKDSLNWIQHHERVPGSCGHVWNLSLCHLRAWKKAIK